MPVMHTAPDTPLFEAVIIPHRSLSRAGTRRLLAVLVFATGVGASVSALLGAWPVAGFAGAELLLAAFLLHRHARAARASEVLLLTSAGLRIQRAAPGRPTEVITLPAAWLRAGLEEEPGRAPRLWLRARDRAEEVASSLNEAEKRDLAGALTEALHRRAHPVFDNPQTRDG